MSDRRKEIWEVMDKLRNEVLEAAKELHKADHHMLANNLTMHVGYAIGVISLTVERPDSTIESGEK